MHIKFDSRAQTIYLFIFCLVRKVGRSIVKIFFNKLLTAIYGLRYCALPKDHNQAEKNIHCYNPKTQSLYLFTSKLSYR